MAGCRGWAPGLALAFVLAMPELGMAGNCTVTSGDFDGNGSTDLQILAGSGKETLTLDDDGTAITLHVDCNASVDGSVYPGIETVIVKLGGLDTIAYNQTAPFSGVVRDLQITLGPNANTVTVTGNNTISANSSIVVDLFGGPNLDVVTIDFGAATLTNSALLVYADLGTGSDTLTVHEPQATASKVDVETSLGQGDNRVVLDSAGSVSASTLRLSVEGGDNALYTRDNVATSVASTLDASSRVYVNANLRDGDDIFKANFPVDTFQALNGSEARVRASGNAANDFLSVSDGAQAGPARVEGLVEAVLRGGPGNDVLDVNWSGLTGSGTLRVREHGGVSVDRVFLGVLTDATSTNKLDLLAQGGRANDTVLAAVFDPGGNASHFPGGAAILDGGLENDICIPFGDGPIESINCESGS